MQALEKIGVLEQDEEKGGRRITQSGQRDLDRECVTGRDSSIGGVWVLMDLVVLGIAQTTLEDSDEEDEE